MFTKGDLKSETIEGERYITFQPNTIVYAVPQNSILGKKCRAAQLGIVFHTSYSGRTLRTMSPSFNIDIGRLQPTKDVWFRDASFTMLWYCHIYRCRDKTDYKYTLTGRQNI